MVFHHRFRKKKSEEESDRSHNEEIFVSTQIRAIF